MIRIGDLVQIGPRYVMGGTYEADEYTGKVMRVVALSGGREAIGPSNHSFGPSLRTEYADLARADILGADEDDAEVTVSLRRLTVVTQLRWGKPI